MGADHNGDNCCNDAKPGAPGPKRLEALERILSRSATSGIGVGIVRHSVLPPHTQLLLSDACVDFMGRPMRGQPANY